MWLRTGAAALSVVALISAPHAQPTASDWVRDDRVFSMGGLYTHRAWSVDAGDIDGDGVDDMVFTTQDGRVEIYRGTGLPGDDAWERMLDWSDDIQLEVPTDPYEEWASRWFVAVTDLNGNGRPELFLTCGDSASVRLCLERSPRQPFRWQQIQGLTEGLSGYIRVASFGDVDGDGDLDMAVHRSVFQWGEPETVLFWNRGTPTQPDWTLDEGYFYTGWLDEWPHLTIELWDADADGDHDLVILDRYPEWCIGPSILLNVGLPADPSWSWYWGIGSDPMESVGYVDFGDLVDSDWDGDGDIDLMLLTAPHGQVFLYENHTPWDSLYIEGPETIGGPIWGQPVISDLDWDGDGDAGVSFGGADLNGPITETAEYRNDGTQTVPKWVSTGQFGIPGGGFQCTFRAMGDLDDDGHEDVIVLGAYPGLCWRRGTADQPVWEYDAEASVGLPAYGTDPSLADIDGDGLVDFVCNAQGGRRFLRNMGEVGRPVWVQWPPWGQGLPNGATTFGRLDGDAFADAVVALQSGILQCFFGHPDQTPAWVETEFYLTGLQLPFSPSGMLLVNLDGGAGNDLLANSGSSVYYSNTGPVGGEDALPSATPLLAVWPNPTDGQITIRLSGAEGGSATLRLYDLYGRLVRSLWQGVLAGPLTFDRRIDSRSAGFFILRLSVGGKEESRGVVLRE